MTTFGVNVNEILQGLKFGKLPDIVTVGVMRNELMAWRAAHKVGKQYEGYSADLYRAVIEASIAAMGFPQQQDFEGTDIETFLKVRDMLERCPVCTERLEVDPNNSAVLLCPHHDKIFTIMQTLTGYRIEQVGPYHYTGVYNNEAEGKEEAV